MKDLLDLDRYPIDRLESVGASNFIVRCRGEQHANGMFNPEGFVRPAAIKRAAAALLPPTDRSAYTLQRRHNV